MHAHHQIERRLRDAEPAALVPEMMPKMVLLDPSSPRGARATASVRDVVNPLRKQRSRDNARGKRHRWSWSRPDQPSYPSRQRYIQSEQPAGHEHQVEAARLRMMVGVETPLHRPLRRAFRRQWKVQDEAVETVFATNEHDVAEQGG